MGECTHSLRGQVPFEHTIRWPSLGLSVLTVGGQCGARPTGAPAQLPEPGGLAGAPPSGTGARAHTLARRARVFS